MELDHFEMMLAKFVTQGRLHENSTGIQVVNFDYYQNEKGKARAEHHKARQHNQDSHKPMTTYELDLANRAKTARLVREYPDVARQSLNGIVPEVDTNTGEITQGGTK